MTSFTRTWNAAYEAQPADTENISLGAGRIRDLKADIQERLEVDHFHAGTSDDGAHKKVDFAAPLGADPANVANHGFLYTKDVSAKAELFWEDEDGNVAQVTSGGILSIGLITTRGDIIRGDSVGAAERHAVGVADTFLGSDGTDVAYVASATKSEQETGTATNKPVTPGRQHFHQSAVKAWLKFDGTGTAAIDVSYNITSITDDATGLFTITIATDLSGVDYAMIGSTDDPSNQPASVGIDGTPAAGSFAIAVRNHNAALVDSDHISITILGDL